VSDLSDLLVERGESRDEVLWSALMRCQDCDCLIIEHDQVAFRCRMCGCDQSQRGLSSYADEHLQELDVALKDAGLSS
jgi:hypothetical protein